MSVIFQTDRLALRRAATADAALLMDLDSDPAVTRYTGPTLSTLGEYEAKIRDEFLKYDTHPVAGLFLAELAGEFVGWFILRPAPDYRHAELTGWVRPTDIEIGYRLKKRFWNQGLATEGAAALVARAFAEPSVTGVVACSLTANRGSTRVMEKIGLARFREFLFPEYGPAVQYARFRDSENPS